MDLHPFDPAHAAEVSAWATSREERLAWCSRPDVDAATVRAWAQEADVDAFVLLDGGRPVAYGEAWTDDEEGEVELARLIVHPQRRGDGVGRRFVAALVTHAHRLHPLATVRVAPHNTAALRCYAAAGFVRVSPEEEAAWNQGQPTDYVWMVCSRRP